MLDFGWNGWWSKKEQFSKFENRFDKIHREVSANSQAVLSLKKDHNALSKLTEETIREKHISMEATLAQHHQYVASVALFHADVLVL